MTRIMQGALWLSIVAALFATFAWPFVFSDDTAFRILGTAAFFSFFVSLVALACKALRTSS